MLSKNNLKFYEQRHAFYQKSHFGLRKLSIGVASVLLSTTFFLGKAHADEVTGNNVNYAGDTSYAVQPLVQSQNN